ncbi:hypothetical protein [Enterobacter chuandaensis]|uniref:hypothetical protein n=1 Tax=Enterobacter chuandaensis TaxID=2497875 RepID=UPI0020C6DB5E|nr:hypothetical protein [Enterobacter chuandaensis]
MAACFSSTMTLSQFIRKKKLSILPFQRRYKGAGLRTTILDTNYRSLPGDTPFASSIAGISIITFRDSLKYRLPAAGEAVKLSGAGKL